MNGSFGKSFDNVIVIDHPVIQTKLTELRDYRSDHRKFRDLLNEIAGLMAYEVTRDWPTKPKPIQTPMERMTGNVLARQVTVWVPSASVYLTRPVPSKLTR